MSDEKNKGIERLRKKANEMRKNLKVPPIDEDEPSGLLSGGPEHLDLEEECKKNNSLVKT